MTRKPERWTTRSYITNKSVNGETHCIQEDIFDLSKQPDGKWKAELIESHVFMTEKEQDIHKNKIMDNAGRVMSGFISNHPDSLLPEGDCELIALLS